MAGNVSIVSVGKTREEQEELLEVAGLMPSTIKHCLDAQSNYDEPESQTPVDAGYPTKANIVGRVGSTPDYYSTPEKNSIQTTPEDLIK